jgi:hypothetical protein
MLSSLLDHAYYLRWLHDWGDNWVCREMNGLATLAIYWPEFKQSQQWLHYASDRMVRAMEQQVYPDGVHKELSSHYHRVTLRDFQNFADLLERSGRQVPVPFKASLKRMWSYLAYTMRPDGYSLLNNDSDLENHRLLLRQVAEVYDRDDWHYIISNGQAGTKPDGEASIVFPWSGQLVMRSGWDINAHWAFFDSGPLGINYHEHQDQLHLSLAAYGRDLLVDGGRYSYVRNDFWQYFRGSVSHNVILIDGHGQKDSRRQWHRPMAGNYAITPELDFVQGTCDRGFRHLPGLVTHSRVIVYRRGYYWVVVDYIDTDRPRQLEPLWHFHPDCKLVIDGNNITSINEEVGNLRIVPASDMSWQVEIVTGQNHPVQGWWSRAYNHLSQSPTAIYRTSITMPISFAWILVPALGQTPQIRVEHHSISPESIHLIIEIPGQPADQLVVQMEPHRQIQVADRYEFTGRCAILRSDSPPLVVHGTITDISGNVIAKHP